MKNLHRQLSKKKILIRKKKCEGFWGFHIVPKEEVFQSVLAKTTILNVQSSKYSTYFYVNYEIVHIILLKIKRGRSSLNTLVCSLKFHICC